MGIETQPALQLADKGGVGHLRAVARHHQIAQVVNPYAVSEQHEIDAGDSRCFGEHIKFRCADCPTIIVGTRRLALWNGFEQRRSICWTALEIKAHQTFCRIETHGPGQTTRSGSQREILGSSTETNENVMIIGIDDGRPA